MAEPNRAHWSVIQRKPGSLSRDRCHCATWMLVGRENGKSRTCKGNMVAWRLAMRRGSVAMRSFPMTKCGTLANVSVVTWMSR